MDDSFFQQSQHMADLLVFVKVVETSGFTAAAMVRAMEDASASLSSLASRPSGRLKVTASVSYGKHVLGPLLPEFHRQYPEIQVELLLVNRHVDLWEEGLDLAIRLTDEPPGALAGRPIHAFDFVPCATPRFLRSKRLSHPEQLAGLHGRPRARLARVRGPCGRRSGWCRPSSGPCWISWWGNWGHRGDRPEFGACCFGRYRSV